MKLWRVRAKMLDIDNDFYKREIEDLRENMIELSRENLLEKDKTYKDSESNSLSKDGGSKSKAVLIEQPELEPETPIVKASIVTKDSRDVSKRNNDAGTAVAEKTQMPSPGSRATLVKLHLKENVGCELPLVQKTRNGDREATQRIPRLKPAKLPTNDPDRYKEEITRCNQEIPRPKAPFKYSNVNSGSALNNSSFMPLPPLPKRTVFPQMDRSGVKSTQSTPRFSAVLDGNNVHLPKIMRPGTPLDRAKPAKLGGVSLPKLVNPFKNPGQPSNEQPQGLNRFTPLPPTAPRGLRSRPYSGKRRNPSQAGGQKKSGAD
ncbi:hypothetical protein SNE40_000108 [Patella caerulea]|uniref:Uncharacterized protein n=1 Tax=Patella caerulea TaxID=87958 RepID=A0AAN8KD50_PATCE